MHPWKKIIRGNTDDIMTKACLICLERINDSDDDIELKLHLYKGHSVNIHLKELVYMCKEAKEREEREGWSLDEILEEERDKREAEAKKRPESGRWMEIFWRKKRTYDSLDNNGEVNEVDCFLCQKQLKSFGYSEHLEKQHRVIFGVKDIKKSSKEYESVPSKTEPDHEEAEPEIIRSDADTVKELIEIKYLPKKRKIRLRTHPQRLSSRNYQVLIEEVYKSLFYCEEDWTEQDILQHQDTAT